MRVFKFGGASIKDAEGVKNLASILKKYNDDDLVLVISAMDKTTNALESVTDSFFYRRGDQEQKLEKVKAFHFRIIESLFPDSVHPVYDEINNAFVELHWAIEGEPSTDYNKEYDQIVSIGEILSSKIVSFYLGEMGIKNEWKDARDFIKTDSSFREGKVEWDMTENLISNGFKGGVILTQGFIAGAPDNYSTTLGREGSDYSAAIIAYCLDAKDVTIWKDVPGLMNADPKRFAEAKKIDQLSYQDAIELAYYGATVIHPKTIKPLQNKKIPLYVKSFIKPEEKGTVINEQQSEMLVPCFIFKSEQILISISPKDLSFIVEENLSYIFKLFSSAGIKINMMQNSAISFSVSIDNDERKIPALLKELQKDYRVLYNENLELITIRYYDQAAIDKVCCDREVLLEQKSRATVQLVVKGK
jgi:aspartate kinase